MTANTLHWDNTESLYNLLMAVFSLCMCISGEGYWVCKASLRNWKKLALDQLEDDKHDTKHSNGQTNGQGPQNNSKGEQNECVSLSLFFFFFLQI